jgi:hypothetical protein
MPDIITEMARAYGITEDQVLQDLYAELLKKVPKIVLTKDENDDVIVHLIDCPLARAQTPYKSDPAEPVKVKKCSCMPEKK